MRLRARAAFALAPLFALPLSACPGSGGGAPDDDSGPACKLAYLGDASAAIVLQATARAADGVSATLNEGDDVALVYPPQGGRVIFVGVRAKNLDPCAVRIDAVIRDPASQEVRLEARDVNLIDDGTGVGASVDGDIASFANVNVCPNNWSDSDLYDHAYELTVSVEDRSGKTASVDLHVTPRCAEPDREAECRCICAHGYILGEDCSLFDAGASDAANDGG